MLPRHQVPAMWCTHSLFKQNATTFDEYIFECVFACVIVPNRMAKILTFHPSHTDLRHLVTQMMVDPAVMEAVQVN